ncbi:MAG: hypothetical protein ACE5J3_07235, partial [Methanosarcinales archaeon]
MEINPFQRMVLNTLARHFGNNGAKEIADSVCKKMGITIYDISPHNIIKFSDLMKSEIIKRVDAWKSEFIAG